MSMGQVKAQGSYEYIKSNENYFDIFYGNETSMTTALDDKNDDGVKVSKK